MKKYDVAAYVWPAYTGDNERALRFWEQGIGEWQTVKNPTLKKRFSAVRQAKVNFQKLQTE